MVDMYPGDKTCILSTLQYIANTASKHNAPPDDTFDQPLFWNASRIKNNVPDTSPVRDVVLLFGRFNTFINLLGALIGGTSAWEWPQRHMFEDASPFFSQWLTKQITAKDLEDEPDFKVGLHRFREGWR